MCVSIYSCLLTTFMKFNLKLTKIEAVGSLSVLKFAVCNIILILLTI